MVLTPSGSGDTVVRMSFTSFGERSYYSAWNVKLPLSYTPALLVVTDKGYTGHEQLDDVGLIHMNGRVYDPKLGRFMSADPHIQAPTDTQSLNRYSYVLNNPLSATDPSGFFSLRKWVGTIVAVVGAVICGPTCSQAGYIAIGASSGAAGAAANGGNIFKGALIGAFTANLFYEIGQYAQNIGSKVVTVEQSWQAGANTFLSGPQYAGVVALHAAAGGVSSVLNGGKFGHGFVSAGFGKAFSHMIAGIGNETGQLVVTMVVAGTASKLVGGKFANGANTAAFQYLFNFLGSDEPKNEKFDETSPFQPDEGALKGILKIINEGKLKSCPASVITCIPDKYSKNYGGGLSKAMDKYWFQEKNITITANYICNACGEITEITASHNVSWYFEDQNTLALYGIYIEEVYDGQNSIGQPVYAPKIHVFPFKAQRGPQAIREWVKQYE